MHLLPTALFGLLIFQLILISAECRVQQGIFKYENPTTVLGTNTPNPYGDGNPALLAKINGGPLAFNEATKEIFVADKTMSVVRKIDVKGIVQTYVGRYQSGFSGDGGLASDALISTPTCLVFFNNSLYICDSDNHVIRKVDSDGIISTVVGVPGNCSKTANDLLLCYPSGLTFSQDGLTMYIAENGCRVKRFTNGTASIIAGQFSSQGSVSNVDGVSAKFGLRAVAPILYDSLLGGLYLADSQKLHFINLTNNFVTLVRSNSPSYYVSLLSDSNYIYTIYPTLIKKLNRNTNNEEPIIGPGIAGYTGNNSSMVQLSSILSAAMVDGQIYFVDSGKLKLFNMVNSTIEIIAGCCTNQFSISNVYGNRTSGSGKSMVLDSNENVYFPDPTSYVFRKIEKSTGIVSELAGTFGVSSSSPKGGLLASEMLFKSPSAIMVNDTSIYLGDSTKLFLLDTKTNLVTQYSSKTYTNIAKIFYDPYYDSVLVYDSPILDRVFNNGSSVTIYKASANVHFVKETNSLFVISSSKLQKINLINMTTITCGGLFDSYISEINLNAVIFPGATCIYATSSEVVYFCSSLGILRLEKDLKISTISNMTGFLLLHANDNEDLYTLNWNSIAGQGQTQIQLYKKSNECFEGFYGPYCNITLCNGKFSNHSKSCSGAGYCSSKGVCNCDFYYYGKDCERKYINCKSDVNSNQFDTSYCNGRGLCRPGTNCLCLSNNFTESSSSLLSLESATAYTGTILTSEDKTCSLIQESTRYIYKCGNTITMLLEREGLKTTFFSIGYFRFGSGGKSYSVYPFNPNILGSKSYSSNDYLLAGNDGSLRRIDSVGSFLYFSNTSIPGKVDNTYGGSDCSNSDCYGYNRDEPFVCSGHGTCLGYNDCKCFTGYYGYDCSIYHCFNISSSNSSVCSGNGQCSEFDTCECNYPFVGKDCSEFTCNGKYSNEPNVCSGNGICSSWNNCTCNLGYTGNDCEENILEQKTIRCFGIVANTSFVCSGNGECIKTDQCQCKEGYTGKKCNDTVCKDGYFGTQCEYTTCSGIRSDEKMVCFGKGHCIDYNTCNCSIGYGPSNVCQYPICGGYLANDPRVCNNSHGVCVRPNECQPLDPNCFGKAQNNSKVCSGNGYCIDWDYCECKSGYNGKECENVSNISGTNSSNFNNSNHNTNNGTLSYTDIVNSTFCNNNNCSNTSNIGSFTNNITDIVNSDNYSKPSNSSNFNNSSNNTNNDTLQHTDIVNSTYCDNNCSGHGVCNNIGKCTCYSDSLNGFWKGQACNQCQLGYYGNQCLTQIIGPATLFNNFMGIRFNLNGPSSNHRQGIVDCSNLIAKSQIILFGTNPICQWVNESSSEFTILFSSDNSYSILPGASLLMNRLVFDNTSQTDYEEIEIILSDNPIRPVVILNGKKYIGYCESLTLDASKSYSVDRKPLKYLWTLISSPNNSIANFLVSNSTLILEIESERLKDSGEYKIGLQVQSTLSSIKSELNVWTFTKAAIPLPIISIIGETEYHIQKSELPIVIKKTVDIPSCFYSNADMNIEWKQLSGPNSKYEIDSSYNIAIISVDGTSDSIYEYQVSSTSVINPLSTSSDIVKITVSSSPLTLQLYLDSLASETASITIEFNDPDQTLENEQWNWICLMNQNKSCGSIIDNYLQTSANQKDSSLEINSKNLTRSTAELELTLSVAKGIRSISKSISITFTKNNVSPPIISLISVTPKTSIIPSDQIINLQLQVTTSSDSSSSNTENNNYITREWTLNSHPLSAFNSLLSFMTIDPSLTNSIVIVTSELKSGVEYQLSLKVTDNRNSLNSIYTHTFSIASPPTPCPCTITPNTGTAFQTAFTFNCQTCLSSQGNIIQTVYGFIDDKSGANIPLSSQGGILSTKLPSSNNNKMTVYIKFTDPQTNAYTSTTTDLQINLPVVKSVLDIKKLVSSWTAVQSSLKDGDPAKMVYNSATISRASNAMLSQLDSKRVLQTCKHGIFNDQNQKCDCLTGYTKLDCSLTIEELEVYQEIRGSLIDGLIQSYESRNPYETLTDSFLTVHILAIESLTSNYDELNSSLFNKSLNLFKQLINIKLSKLPIGVDILIRNTINNMYLYLKYSESDTSIIYDLSKSFSLLQTSGMFVGQKDDHLITNFGELSSNKMFRNDFSLKNISLQSNSIKLPSNMALSINQKSDRKSIAFTFISSIDLFGIGKSLEKSEMFNSSKIVNNTQQISTSIISTRYIRSEILNFELLDSKILEITKEIEYNIKYSDIENYSLNTLISSSLNDSIITNIYKSSEISCISFNITNMKENLCNLTQLSFGIATCKCKSNSNVMIIENVIQKVERLSQFLIEKSNKSDQNSLAIILGTILGFTFCLLITLITMVCIKMLYSKIMKEKINKAPNNDVEMKPPTISV